MFWLLLSSACPGLGISLPLLRAGQRDTPSHKTLGNSPPSAPKPSNKQGGGLPSKGAVAWRLGAPLHLWEVVSAWLCITCLFLLPASLTPLTYQTIFHWLNHFFPHLGLFSLHSLSHPAVEGGNKWPWEWLAAVGCNSISYRKNREEKKLLFNFWVPEWSHLIPVVQYLVHWNCSTGDAHILGLAGYGSAQTRNVVSAFLL